MIGRAKRKNRRRNHQYGFPEATAGFQKCPEEGGDAQPDTETEQCKAGGEEIIAVAHFQVGLVGDPWIVLRTVGEIHVDHQADGHQKQRNQQGHAHLPPPGSETAGSEQPQPYQKQERRRQ